MDLTISQKKILGIVLLVIFIPIELLLLAVLVYSVITNGVTQNEISSLFTMGIFFFPLWLGIRIWKAGNSKQPIIPDSNDSIIDANHSSDSIIKIQVKIS